MTQDPNPAQWASALPDFDVYERLRALRKSGWTVKFERDEKTKKLVSIKVNKNHVNLRVEQTISNGCWHYSIYTRNQNGGYVRRRDLRDRCQDLESAIAVAQEIAAQDAPPIPVWDKDALPEPLTINCDLVYHESGVRQDYKNHNKPMVSTTIQTLITHITILGVVGLEKDCTITEDAAIVPGNRTWFLADCTGTSGRFRLVTDGTRYYPVRRKSATKEKIILDPRIGNIDLSQLNMRDQLNLELAIKNYVNWYTKQHH